MYSLFFYKSKRRKYLVNNQALQILRGDADVIASKTEYLLGGQLLYNLTTNQLYCGGETTNEIKSTKPITSEELKKYDNRNKGLWQETGSLTFKDEGAGFKIESKDTLSILQHSVLEATEGIFDFYDDSRGRETKMRITPQSITCFNAEAAGVTFKIDYKGLTFQEEPGEQLPQIKLVRTRDSFAINKSMLSGASSYPTSLSFDSNTLTFSQTYGSAVRSISFTPGLDISSTVESGTATFYLNEGVYSGVISGVPNNRITFPKGRVTLATTDQIPSLYRHDIWYQNGDSGAYQCYFTVYSTTAVAATTLRSLASLLPSSTRVAVSGYSSTRYAQYLEKVADNQINITYVDHDGNPYVFEIISALANRITDEVSAVF